MFLECLLVQVREHVLDSLVGYSLFAEELLENVTRGLPFSESGHLSLPGKLAECRILRLLKFRFLRLDVELCLATFDFLRCTFHYCCVLSMRCRLIDKLSSSS